MNTSLPNFTKLCVVTLNFNVSSIYSHRKTSHQFPDKDNDKELITLKILLEGIVLEQIIKNLKRTNLSFITINRYSHNFKVKVKQAILMILGISNHGSMSCTSVTRAFVSK